jgi:hypothetical protein
MFLTPADIERLINFIQTFAVMLADGEARKHAMSVPAANAESWTTTLLSQGNDSKVQGAPTSALLPIQPT